MEREMEVAREIQLSMVPLQRPNFAGYDFGARMVSARAVGGDFFDFIQLSPNLLGIAIGDVSDKGVPAALFMALTSNLLRAEARRTPDPTIAVRNVHRQLMEVNSSGMFVTLLYGTLDVQTRVFNYARAGHELPFLTDPTGKLASLPYNTSLPVGADDEITIDQQTVHLEPGCSLLLYTDGLTDVVDSDSSQFGIERAQSSFMAAREKPAQQICDTLFQATINHRGDAPQYDDITLLAIHSR